MIAASLAFVAATQISACAPGSHDAAESCGTGGVTREATTVEFVRALKDGDTDKLCQLIDPDSGWKPGNTQQKAWQKELQAADADPAGVIVQMPIVPELETNFFDGKTLKPIVAVAVDGSSSGVLVNWKETVSASSSPDFSYSGAKDADHG